MTQIDGPVMLTASGEYISPLYPWHFTPSIDDIAHALSQINRFTGHTSKPYSVAEHSCRVSDLLPDGFRLAGLLHDAAEAYLGDMASPLKHHPMFGEAYRSAENALMARIDEVFHVDTSHQLVHEADLRMLATERRDLMPEVEGEWLVLRGVKPLRDGIVPWSASWARHNFMGRFYALTRARVAA